MSLYYLGDDQPTFTLNFSKDKPRTQEFSCRGQSTRQLVHTEGLTGVYHPGMKHACCSHSLQDCSPFIPVLPVSLCWCSSAGSSQLIAQYYQFVRLGFGVRF